HPVDFMAALLTNDRANTDKVVKDIAECREMGIPVLPPDVNESDLHFTAVGSSIRFGLAAVKNVGEAALESVLAARSKAGPFRGLLDFCERVDLQKVNRKVIESLVQCGAFDSLGGTRAQYLAYVDRCLERGTSAQKDRARGQTNLFELLAPTNGNGQADPSADELPAVPPLQPSRQLQAEKEVLGMYLSGHPLVEWDDLLKTYTDGRLSELLEKPDKSTVTVGGTVAAVKAITTKNGSRMAFVTLEDVEGAIEIVVFSDLYAKAANLLSSDEPLLVRGTLEKSEDSGKILAEEIHPLGEAQERLAKAVHIHVNGALHTRDDLGTLRALLEKPDHRGPCQAYLHILLPERAETVIRLPESLGLRATAALKAEVHALIGNEHCVQFR
ncbi:MAG: DNA polymerase III subunit alpha, partial [Deltaproteobacteria bacterium]|nr:DNA polymerase III subunit alpha [Deltaproteobacteria bacterium]